MRSLLRRKIEFEGSLLEGFGVGGLLSIRWAR